MFAVSHPGETLREFGQSKEGATCPRAGLQDKSDSLRRFVA
jgi:hypothetical protein